MRKSITIIGIIMFIMGILMMVKDVVVPVGIAVYYGIFNNADVLWTDTFVNLRIVSSVMAMSISIIGYLLIMIEDNKEYLDK